jgi:hypothetical protein
MSHAKTFFAAVLAIVALAACGGSIAKPPDGRGKVDDPRTNQPDRLACLLADHLPAVKVGQTGIQIGALPAGPTIQFVPTTGIAQGLQIEDQEQGAEIIGTALLYPHQAPDGELSLIQGCLQQGVSG